VTTRKSSTSKTNRQGVRAEDKRPTGVMPSAQVGEEIVADQGGQHEPSAAEWEATAPKPRSRSAPAKPAPAKPTEHKVPGLAQVLIPLRAALDNPERLPAVIALLDREAGQWIKNPNSVRERLARDLTAMTQP
jgi:hypothetical protein